MLVNRKIAGERHKDLTHLEVSDWSDSIGTCHYAKVVKF